MAAGRLFVCTDCARTIETWDDGNPYYLDAQGAKRYAYHPSAERARCTGNDAPVLCLGCGTQDIRDSAAPAARCAPCGSAERVDLWELEGRTCPYCKTGTFGEDPTFFAVS